MSAGSKRLKIDIGFGDPGELFAQAQFFQLAQRPPDRRQCGDHRNQEGDQQAEWPDTENEILRSDGTNPPVCQSVDH